MTMIELDRVTFAFPGCEGRPAINDLSLKIRRGEELAVIGGNGSGKTTFGLLLAGILKPQSGKILIDGRPVNDNREKSSIGFLFQDPDNGLVATTVDREVAFSLENRNMTVGRMQSLVEKHLAMFGLMHLRKRMVWQLSGGEKQRLCLAALLVSDTRILFLDEPASYLDFPGTKILEEALSSIKNSDKLLTTIRITQFPELAEKFERVILIDQGRIAADETPQRLFSQKKLLDEAGLRPPLKYLTAVAEPADEPDSRALAINGSPLAELSSLNFKYDIRETSYVIENVSLSLYGGKVLALTGPSGCGKSTLAQIICGIYRPEMGEIKYPSGKVRAVMSFQQPERQFFLDSVYDEVAYGLKKRAMSDDEIEKTVRISLETVGLDYESFKGRDPFSLSGGEARRLAFALTITLDGDIIIFDEPSCGLDEHSIRIFKQLVNRLKGEGKAIAIITHNSDLIGDVADEVVLMKNGRVIFSAPPLEFFSTPEIEEVLAIPHVIDYQYERYGRAVSARQKDIFEP